MGAEQVIRERDELYESGAGSCAEMGGTESIRACEVEGVVVKMRKQGETVG